MSGIEQKIKDFVKEQGVEIVGVAGPDRLDGPPSLDPTYTMAGAKSIVSMAVPMNVDAIYKFLGKESNHHHNVDQTRMNTRLHRIASLVAGYIESLGYRAGAVPSNNSYRRSPDAFATHPSFSHRFGALASGIGAQGWSGNVMTEEHGASIYLGTVVTEAVLQSDKPRFSPRHFIDEYCYKCRLCEKTCVAGMFEAKGEEYILINGELHPRGKRRNIDLCNASCFGLHSLSRDKKWTTWGTSWIDEWIEKEPDPKNKLKMRQTLFKEGIKSGDSTPRYSIIRETACVLQPEEFIESYCDEVEESESETERFKKLKWFADKLGAKSPGLLKNERILTCGQCALVCGPTIDECHKRYNLLINGGFVVPGPNNESTVVKTYEEALEMRKKYLPKVPVSDMIKDFAASTVMWHQYYAGIEPKSVIGGITYDRKLKKAVKDRKPGFKLVTE
jgi:ferredoxin